MKRIHVHVGVEDLEQSIGFYSALFATQPSVVKADYAKWMLDDPRVNFAISTRGKRPGLDHLGIQVESKDELGDVYARLRRAGGTIIEQGQTTCCYATSEKIVDRRSGRHLMGNVLHHGREHALWRRHRRAWRAHRARKGVL
jgi:catechol 2,3-dioxygenase-like lactoylglutathione lyase family enzyme